MMHTFENFQKMVDNAILVERARQEMGEQKRKFEPPQGTPFHPGGQNVNFGQS
jgi:hypothetical protein